MEIASAFVSLLPSAKGFGSKVTSQVSGEMGGAGRKVGGLFGKAFGVAAGLGAGALAAKFVTDSVKSLGRIERINAQTAQAIKSTGGAAGVSAKHVENLAGRLENLTASEAEATQEGANLLLTFTNIRNETGRGNAIFDRATKTIVDMSRTLGQDTKSSAIQLGKALNDPIKGVTALQRVGVSFTEKQRDQIKALVDSGQTMKAQKLILGELNREFGGSGKAFAQTTEGQVQLAKHAIGTLGETLTAGLLPPLGKLAGFAARALNDLVANIGPIQGAIASIFSGPVGNSVGSFVDTIVTNLLPVLQTAGATFTGVILPAVVSLASYLAGQLVPVFQQVWGILSGQVLPILSAVAQFIYGRVYPAIAAIVIAVVQNLRPAFEALVAVVQAQILPTISRLLAKFREWGPTLGRVATVVLKVVGFILKLAAAILGKVLPVVIRLVGFLIGKLVGALATVIGWIVKIIGWVLDFGGTLGTAGKAVGRFAKAAAEKFLEVVRWVRELPKRILAAIGNIGLTLYDKGRDLIAGFINGIKAMAGQLISAIKSTITDKLPGFVKKALGISSPSRVFHGFGENVMQGMARGLRAGAADVQAALVAATPGIEIGSAQLRTSPRFDDVRGRRNGLDLSDRSIERLARRISDLTGPSVGRALDGAASDAWKGVA